MNKLIIPAIVVAAAVATPAWSQAQQPQGPRFQPKAYFEMPLEKDPTRQVRLQSVVIPAGAGNQFHRHPGDQWWAVQEGEVTYTVKGQPPRVLKAGDFVYVPRGTIQPERFGQFGARDRAQHHRQGQAANRAGGGITTLCRAGSL